MYSDVKLGTCNLNLHCFRETIFSDEVCNYLWMLKIAGRHCSEFRRSLLSTLRTKDLLALWKTLTELCCIQWAVTNFRASDFHNIVITGSQCLQMYRPLQRKDKHIEEKKNKGGKKPEDKWRQQKVEASIYSHRPVCWRLQGGRKNIGIFCSQATIWLHLFLPFCLKLLPKSDVNS